MKILKVFSFALPISYFNYERIENIAVWLQARVNVKPTIAIVCGSGLGTLADKIANATSIPYEDIPNFPQSTGILNFFLNSVRRDCSKRMLKVQGHHGNLVFGEISNVPVVAMQGRFHPYEGYTTAVCTLPIKVFKLLGVKIVILTNAAGGVNPAYKVGDLMILKDHISYPSLALQHPLVGPNDERFGPRFMPINKIYTKPLRDLFRQVAEQADIQVQEGVYSVIGELLENY
jgi:purine-nucleoside phosphorylase